MQLHSITGGDRKYKVSVKEVMKVQGRVIMADQPKQTYQSNCPPCHIEEEESESFDATPYASQLIQPRSQSRPRRRIFGNRDRSRSHDKNSNSRDRKQQEDPRRSNYFSFKDVMNGKNNEAPPQDNCKFILDNNREELPFHGLNQGKFSRSYEANEYVGSSRGYESSHRPSTANFSRFQDESKENKANPFRRQALSPKDQSLQQTNRSPTRQYFKSTRHEDQQQSNNFMNKNSFAHSQHNSSKQTDLSQYYAQQQQKMVSIEQKIQEHEEQLASLRNKIEDTRRNQDSEQTKLLSSLYKKQEQLCARQSQLDSQLQKIMKISQQIKRRNDNEVGRNLERKREQRLLQLTRENEKLYETIVIQESRHKSNGQVIPSTDDELFNNSVSPMNVLSVFRDNNHNSISALQPYRYDEEPWEENNSMSDFLSPFAFMQGDL